MSDLDNIHISFSTLSDNNLISLLQYGDDQFDDTKKKKKNQCQISDFFIWLLPVLISQFTSTVYLFIRFLDLVVSSTYILIYFYCISLLKFPIHKMCVISSDEKIS